MNIPNEYKGKYFYHFTHIDNLDSILKNGFICTNKKNKLKISHTNVASENIQTRRSDMDVTCNPKGKVHDYVPFYFTTRNPMLLALTNNKNIDQPFLIFFAISIEKIVDKKVVFTDASANTDEPPNFYNDPKDLGNLDWKSIDSTKWGCKNDDDRHKRMSEVLIHEKVPLQWVESIIVWNKNFKKIVINTYKSNEIVLPKVQYDLHDGKYFYFTKFQFMGRDCETLVTGPYYLKSYYDDVTKSIIQNRKKNNQFLFDSINDTLKTIEKNFCSIEELEGIFELETINDVHDENVSDHTLIVVDNLSKNDFYNGLDDKEKQLVKLAAYLHDIGKGPGSKWPDGKQKAYADHPADSLKMMDRILSNDIKVLSKSDVKIICKLVGYHDIIGDIISKGRSKKELYNIIDDEKELNMLIALTIADILAINVFWHRKLIRGLPDLIKEVKENLK
jgi:hypothetical protein